MSDVRVRRATFDDYDAALEIYPHFIGGLDYLPILYHSYLQSKRHAVYVVEATAKELVALVNYRLDADGVTAYSMSMRVREDYQQKGLTIMIYRQLHSDYPNLNYFVYAGQLNPASRKALHKFTLLSLWNFARLDTFGSSLKHMKPTSVASTRTRPVLLTHSDCVDLVTSGCCEKFLRKFSDDFILGADCSWRPVRLHESDLKELLAGTYTLVNFADDFKQGNVDVATKSVKWNQEIRAMSISYSMLLKTRDKAGNVRADIHFFGNELSDFVQHCRHQLRHLATISGTSELTITFLFPSELDRTAAVSQLATDTGLNVCFEGEGYLARATYSALVRDTGSK